METRANYVLIGAFTLVASVGLLLFGLWAANYSSQRSWQAYLVMFDEAVTGLTVGSPVQYNGIAVGSIESLSLDPADPRRVVARLRISAEAPVKTDTRAKLAITSLTGPTIIQLSGGSPDAPSLVTASTDTVPVIATSPSALQNITDTANRIVERLDQLLSDDNVARLTATLGHLEQTTAQLADRDQGTQAVLVGVRDAARALETTLGSTNRTVNRIDRDLVQQLPALVAQLERTLARLESTATNADALVQENRPALQQFANDGLGQLGPTLNELRGLIRDLRQVSERLDNNPAGYLLGREAPKEFDPQ